MRIVICHGVVYIVIEMDVPLPVLHLDVVKIVLGLAVPRIVLVIVAEKDAKALNVRINVMGQNAPCHAMGKIVHSHAMEQIVICMLRINIHVVLNENWKPHVYQLILTVLLIVHGVDILGVMKLFNHHRHLVRHFLCVPHSNMMKCIHVWLIRKGVLF